MTDTGLIAGFFLFDIGQQQEDAFAHVEFRGSLRLFAGGAEIAHVEGSGRDGVKGLISFRLCGLKLDRPAKAFVGCQIALRWT